MTGRYAHVPIDQEFAVIWIGDDTPEWWRVIARFKSERRAQIYCDVENDWLADSNTPDDDVTEEPPEDAEPPDALEERTGEGADAPLALPAPEPPSEPDEVDEPADADRDVERVHKPAAAPVAMPRRTDLVGADGLTDNQRNVWIALARLISETGLTPAYSTIGAATGLKRGAVSVTLKRLAEIHYLRRSGGTREPVWHVLRWPEGVEPRETTGLTPASKPQSPPPPPAKVEVATEPEAEPPERDSGPVMDRGSFGADTRDHTLDRPSPHTPKLSKMGHHVQTVRPAAKVENGERLDLTEPPRAPLVRRNPVNYRGKCSTPGCNGTAQQNHMRQCADCTRKRLAEKANA